MPFPRATRRIVRSRLGTVLLALLTAVAGIVVVVVGAPAAAAAGLPAGFKSVGYMPSWAGSVSAIQYRKLTHVNYAFVLPRADGTIGPVENPAKLQALVSQGHANGVKVLLSIGGWNDGNDSAFESLAANSTARGRFVAAAMALVTQYNLDGIDVDWEYPDPGVSGDRFTVLMTQLGTALHGRGKLLTAAVVSGGYTAQGVQPAVFRVVDFLNIMLYDGGTPHANYTWSINDVNEWKARGLPAAKAVLGVPFFSRPGYYSYSRLVALDPANADRDCATVAGVQQCYNGRPTVRRKTLWAMANAGGMMNWELTQDSAGATSLVSAIYDTAMGARSGPITGVAGKCVDVKASGTANGTGIQLYSCNGTEAQRWTVVTDGTLRAIGKCMDVVGSGLVNGTKVQLYTCNATGAQLWRPAADGTLRNPQSGKCLSVAGTGSANGTPLHIWTCGAKVNQLWRLP
ncbi:glycosyl hydrolase family 18 protein [Nakamurella sp. GG22]